MECYSKVRQAGVCDDHALVKRAKNCNYFRIICEYYGFYVEIYPAGCEASGMAVRSVIGSQGCDETRSSCMDDCIDSTPGIVNEAKSWIGKGSELVGAKRPSQNKRRPFFGESFWFQPFLERQRSSCFGTDAKRIQPLRSTVTKSSQASAFRPG